MEYGILHLIKNNFQISCVVMCCHVVIDSGKYCDKHVKLVSRKTVMY